MSSTKKRGILMASLWVMVALACVVLVGCGGTQNPPVTQQPTPEPETPVTSVFTIYNTAEMQDNEILNLFSEQVLQEVKNDTRNRTIVIYEVGADVEIDTEITWVLSNEDGWSSAEQPLDIYVDEAAPDLGDRTVRIMIGWDEADLDKTWTVTIYNGSDADKVELASVSFDVTSDEYVKA